jgi:hypothetical protein
MNKKVSFWQEHIEIWQVSGQSQKAYCTQHQLTYPTFNYWRRKLTHQSQESDTGTFCMIPCAHDLNLDPVPGVLIHANGLTLALGQALITLTGTVSIAQLLELATLCNSHTSKDCSHVSS